MGMMRVQSSRGTLMYVIVNLHEWRRLKLAHVITLIVKY